MQKIGWKLVILLLALSGGALLFSPTAKAASTFTLSKDSNTITTQTSFFTSGVGIISCSGNIPNPPIFTLVGQYYSAKCNSTPTNSPFNDVEFRISLATISADKQSFSGTLTALLDGASGGTQPVTVLTTGAKPPPTNNSTPEYSLVKSNLISVNPGLTPCNAIAFGLSATSGQYEADCAVAGPNGTTEYGWTLTDFNLSADGRSYSATLTPYAGGVTGGTPGTTSQITIAKPSNITLTPPSPVNNDSGTTTDNCPMGDGALRWVLCPIFDIAAKTLGALDAALQSLLNVDINTVFSPDFEQVFGSIRQISISLIVVAGLIMVISQAAGLELLSAYTIRKLLPRLAIAVIGMAIAWPLLKFIVGFVNDLGNWIQLILLHVAQATPATQGQNNSLFESIISVPLGLAGGAAVALVAWGILGTGGIFAILGMAILALLVGFLVLTIRQIVIILCVILAPIAIASAVIPGTQRLWQFWRSTFTSTLLMFPIIMGFLGAGKAIAYLIGKSGPTGNGTLQVMAIFMYLAPYFMLPFAFRMAGGLMANVSGMVQNRAQAPRQWLTKRRQASSEAMAARRRSGNLYKNAPPGSFRGRINRGVAVGSNLGALGFDPRNWRANARSTFGNTQVFEEASEALQKNGHLAAVLQDGTLLASGMTTARFADGSRSRGTMADIRRYLSEKGQEGDVLDDNVAAVWAARQSMSTEAYDVAATIGRTATGTDWEDTGEFYRTVAEASHGNAALAAQLYGASRSAATKANQLEIGGVGFRTGLEQVNRAFNGEAVDVDKTLLDVANTNEAVNISRSRKAGVEKVANAVAANVTRLNSDLPDLTPDEAQELGKQTKVLDALQFYGDNYSAPDRQVIINTAAESAEHATINVHQVIDEASQEPVTYDIHTRARVQGEPNAPPTNIAKGFGRRLQPPQTNTNGPRDPNNPPPAP